MAGSIKGITIEFRGDTTSLDKALRDIQKEGKQTETDLRAVNRALKFNPGNTELLRQKFTLLSQKINSTESELKQLKSAEATLKSNNVSRQSQEWMTVQRKIVEAESKLSHYKAELAALRYEKIAAMGKTFQDVGGKMQNVGRNMSMYVTAPIVGVGAAAIKTGMEFDQQMSKVKAISGATGKDFDDLRSKAREMGSKTKFSATEAGQGFEYMAMAGWDTNSMLKGIKPVLDLAAASGEDLGKTSDIVTDAMTAFGLEAKDASHFADVLARTSTKANTNVGMMGESFKYVAPVAGSMGYKVEDVSLALGVMANAGIKASSAGTSLRTLMTNMAKPTDAMATAMDTLGVSLDDGHGNMKSFKQVMDDLRKGFGNLKMEPAEVKKRLGELDKEFSSGAINQKQYNAAQSDLMKSAFGAEGALKAEAAATLAGKTGMSGLMAIISASDEDYNELAKSIGNCDGAASKMADTMIDNNAGAFTILKSALSEAAIAINDRLAPTVKSAIEFIQGLVDKFNSLPKGMQDTIIKIAALIAAIGPLTLVGGTLLKSIGGVMSALPGIMGTLPKLIGLVTSTGGAIKGLATGTSLLQTPISGVLGIFALLAAALVLLYTKSETFREAVNGLVTSIGKALQPVVKAIGDMFKQLAPVIGKLAATIGNALAPIIKALVPIISQVIGVVAAIVAKIVQVLTPALKVIITVVRTILSVVGPILEGLLDIITTIFGGILTTAKAVWGTIKTVILGVWNALKTAAKAVWNGIKTAVMVPILAVKALLTAAWNGIKTAALTVWNALKLAAKQLWNSIKQMITKPINAVKTWLAGVWTTIKNKASEVWNGIKSTASNVWGKIKSAVTKPIEKAKKSLGEIWDGIKSKASEVWDKVKSTASDAWEGIKKAITKPINTAKDTIKGIIDKIKGFFDFDFKLPKIKLPHFSIKPKGWKLSDLLKGKIPSLGIDWYAKGAIFTKPTVIGNKGFGEAGAEAALPLKMLWDEMSGMFKMMGDNIVNGVMTGMAAQGGGEVTVEMPVYLYPNSQKMGQETVKIYDRYKKILG